VNRRDQQLRQALDFSLAHAVPDSACAAIFGALGSLVETPADGEALEMAQRGILALLGGLPPGSTLQNRWVHIETIDTEGESGDGESTHTERR